MQNVTTAVTTSVSTSDTGAETPPRGFRLGNPPIYYELSTTAVFTGAAQVFFGWSAGQYPNERRLKLFHYKEGVRQDVTTSLDVSSRWICGCSVSSFSSFILAEPA